MINSLMPYEGDTVQVMVAQETYLTGVLHCQTMKVVFVGEWRVGVDKILAWRLA